MFDRFQLRWNGGEPAQNTIDGYYRGLEGENIRVSELLKHVIDDVRKNKSAGFIGARFHQTMSAVALKTSQLMREKYGVNEVALSGGVWQNQVLLDLARTALIHNGFIVFTHQQTPANDGGLALGQAAVASFKIRDGGTK